MPAITMPDVGESVTEGTVVRWLKREGEAVRVDEPVVEIETEKVSVEVPSPYDGRLSKILVQEGEIVPVGAPLAEFELAAGSATANGKQQTAKAANHASAAKEQQPTESRQQSAPRVSPQPDGGAPRVGATVRATGELPRARRYSPVVLKLATEHGIDLALVQGTGIEGRVTRQDVLRYLESPVAHTVPPAEGAGVVGVAAERGAPAAERRPAPEARPQAERATEPLAADSELQPLSPTRRTIAARMLESHRTVPVAWTVVEADVTELAALRAAAKEAFQREEGVALTYLPFFIQAIVGALKQHPRLNATFADDGVRVHHRHHIGIAVAAESGLIVPVIRDADRKSIAGLARELDELGEKARSRRLAIDDVRGATFTVDNTGAFGSVLSQPIVPPGQAAIVTTEAVRRELRVADDGSFAARSVMNLCLSFDHRALDGAQAGAFMQAVRRNLESIRRDQPVY